MSCLNPFTISVKSKFWNHFKNVTVGCGYCLNCLETRISQIDFLAQRELLTRYKKGQSAAYCTFTYSDENIPYSDSGFQTLRRTDVQKFIKRIRRNIDYDYRNHPSDAPKFKVMYCGEYGGQRSRPHYHIIFFGLSALEVELYAKRSWNKGLWDVQPAGNGCIRYCCKYLMKSHPSKEIKEFYDKNGVEKPFFYHSVGFAKEWIESNLEQIVEDGFTFWSYGKKRLYPKYVMRYVSYKTGVSYINFVQDFIYNSSTASDARNNHISFSQADWESSYVRYKSSVVKLRQSGEPVDDITTLKSFRNPYTRSNIQKFINGIDAARVSRDFNKYGDVVPF